MATHPLQYSFLENPHGQRSLVDCKELDMTELLVLFLLTVWSFSIFGYKEYNQSEFGVDRLVMSMCRVVSCTIGRRCSL